MITFECKSEKDFPFDVNEYKQFTIQTDKGPKHYQITSIESHRDVQDIFSREGWSLTIPCYKTIILAEEIKFITVKTKEEKLAEETVKAAKEALHKAEKTLKAVRDSK